MNEKKKIYIIKGKLKPNKTNVTLPSLRFPG